MSKEKIEELRQLLNELFEKRASYVDILKISHELDALILEEQKKLEKIRKQEIKEKENE
jgi:hypothetical protein